MFERREAVKWKVVVKSDIYTTELEDMVKSIENDGWSISLITHVRQCWAIICFKTNY
jgi:hypothetical protein